VDKKWTTPPFSCLVLEDFRFYDVEVLLLVDFDAFSVLKDFLVWQVA